MKVFLLVLCAFFTSTVFSQVNLYPKQIAPWELDKLADYQAASIGITSPPNSKVRSMAEWEEAQALVVTWTSYTSVLANIIKAAQTEGNVIVLCSNPTSVKQNLSANQVDTNLNITYLQTPFNSVWCRDYGANSVYKNDVDSLYLVDWIYNRPRYKDDTSAIAISNLLNLPLFTTTKAPYDLVNTGGNFMTDGSGNAFASKLVLEENGSNNKYGKSNHTNEGVDSIMNLFMGIDNYIKMEILPDDGIHHIDMHMKLLNETTLLVGKYPDGEPDADQIEANLQYVLQNNKTIFGTDFKVIRIPMPPYSNGTYPGNGFNRTYTNATFFNKTIILPSYETKYDTTALRIWQEALPGYKIAMVNCNSPIQSGGAVHCITKEIGANEPIRIVHNPLTDYVNYSITRYYTSAKIQHVKGIKLATIFFKTDTSSIFKSFELIETSNNEWVGNFPSFPEGTKVFYYIKTESKSGKVKTHPIPAPEGLWNFEVKKLVNNIEIATEQTPYLGNIYPNPSKSLTCIPVFSNNNQIIELFLTDVLGNKVKTIYVGNSSQPNYFIHANELPAGIYFVVLKSENGIRYQKLIIK